jgi:hypothetical protein
MFLLSILWRFSGKMAGLLSRHRYCEEFDPHGKAYLGLITEILGLP